MIKPELTAVPCANWRGFESATAYEAARAKAFSSSVVAISGANAVALDAPAGRSHAQWPRSSDNRSALLLRPIGLGVAGAPVFDDKLAVAIAQIFASMALCVASKNRAETRNHANSWI